MQPEARPASQLFADVSQQQTQQRRCTTMDVTDKIGRWDSQSPEAVDLSGPLWTLILRTLNQLVPGPSPGRLTHFPSGEGALIAQSVSAEGRLDRHSRSTFAGRATGQLLADIWHDCSTRPVQATPIAFERTNPVVPQADGAPWLRENKGFAGNTFPSRDARKLPHVTRVPRRGRLAGDGSLEGERAQCSRRQGIGPPQEARD
jgi:hypothetical protein